MSCLLYKRCHSLATNHTELKLEASRSQNLYRCPTYIGQNDQNTLKLFGPVI